MVVQHITGYQSLSFETLSFLLTLLAATVTPVFVLSEHWIHLPCGCIINCRRNSYAVSSEELKTKHRGFEFNLSFQHGYGIYRISPESHHHDGDGKSTSCHNLLVCEKPCEPPRGGGGAAARAELSTADSARPGPAGFSTTDSAQPGTAGVRGEAAPGLGRSVEGPERRLSHEEGHKPELTDWEWCRSKSERTPRQAAQPILLAEVFHPWDYLSDPPLDALQQVCVSPLLRTPHLDAVNHVRFHSPEQRGRITSIILLATLLVMQPRIHNLGPLALTC